MATTLQIESFGKTNLKERTRVRLAAVAGDVILKVDSTQELAVGDILYVGAPAREECEKAVVLTVDDAETFTLTAALKFDHAVLDEVNSVLGDLIKVYRAANVDGTVPADESFTVLATRSINPEALSTYYTDSSGDSSWWYRSTYFNATTLAETDLKSSPPVRGDDFGHYASTSDIRTEAGFQNAHNLSDVVVDQQRRAAEAEINIALTGVYTLPFTSVPPIIKVVTIKLAAGFLLQQAFGVENAKGKALRDEARLMLANLKSGADDLPDTEGLALNNNEVTSWPNDTTATTDVEDGGSKALFHIGDTF